MQTLALAVVFLAGACATQDTKYALEYDPGRASEIFTIGYQDVSDIYIENLRISQMALASLDGLSSIDPGIDVAVEEDHFSLQLDGKETARFSRPGDGDVEAWGHLTATAIETGRSQSQLLSTAEAEAVYKATFGGLISELDDYSRYAGRDQARENRASRDGFGGIGVRIRMVDEGVKVLSVMENTPAEIAGLMDQDLIVAIDGQSAAGISQQEAVRRLRGPIRSKVRLTVARESAGDDVLISVVRAHIVPQTIKYTREGNVAYIRIAGFNQDTSRTLRKKILIAEQEIGSDLRGFVLDLRGNPGGLLDQSVEVSDLFIRRGRIVSTHGRHPDSHQFFEAESDDLANGLPIVVLVNGGSASASEIVAAALQDAGRAVLVGSNSYGKGTVQTVLRLPNEGELTLTWARFHAPSGYALQKRGVLPHVCTSGENQNVDQLIGKIRTGHALIDWSLRSKDVTNAGDDTVAALRAQCPLTESDQEIDLQVALRILRDEALYTQVVRSAPATALRSATSAN
ncbi:MAG: S41 family peptidase [Pseudomonadota bacterium]